MIDYQIISTGSQGNAVIINDSILIDCGVPFKALKDYYKKFKLVLLTHIHSDHFNRRTLAALARNKPGLRFACCEWLYQPLLDAGIPKRQIDVLQIGNTANYKAFQVIPVKLYHNVPNCGYRIFMNGKKLFYATDTNTLNHITAKNYDLYMVEANYEDKEIRERIKEKTDQGQYAYEYDVLENHLSKRKADDFIYSNAGSKSLYVYMHQHIARDKT